MIQRTLEEIDSYKVPEYLVERVAEHNGYSLEYSQMLAREAKRMLYLTTLTPEATVPSYVVDMAWHEMIVFTKWYEEYAVFIGKFIHHIPEKPPAVPRPSLFEKVIRVIREKFVETKEVPDSPAYKKTKENYERYLKEKPDKQYWP